MSKKYTTKKDDTLSGISLKEYGTASKWTAIWSANPEISDPDVLRIGQLLTIPDLDVSKLDEKSVPDLSPNTLSKIFVGGKDITDFIKVDFTFSLDGVADTLSFKIFWNIADKDLVKLFEPFTYPTLKYYVGSELVLNGFVISVKPVLEIDGKFLEVIGYSKTGVLNDCCVPLSNFPLLFNDLTLNEIAIKVCGFYDIKVVDNSGDSFKFKDVEYNPTEKIYDFLVRLARKRGVLLTCNFGGELVLQKANSGKATFSLEEGLATVLDIETNFEGQKGFSSVGCVLKGDEEIEADFFVESDDLLKGVNRSINFELDNINNGSLKEAAKSFLRRSWGERVKYKITLKGFKNEDNELFKQNMLVALYFPTMFIKNKTDFLIRGGSLSESRDKKICFLNVVLPQAYNTALDLKKLPWG